MSLRGKCFLQWLSVCSVSALGVTPPLTQCQLGFSPMQPCESTSGYKCMLFLQTANVDTNIAPLEAVYTVHKSDTVHAILSCWIFNWLDFKLTWISIYLLHRLLVSRSGLMLCLSPSDVCPSGWWMLDPSWTRMHGYVTSRRLLSHPLLEDDTTRDGMERSWHNVWVFQCWFPCFTFYIL